MEREAEKVPARDLVFVSYSHTDASWLERLKVHLKPLERKGTIQVWHDQQIAAGSRWRDEIETALRRARVAVLLVSQDFLASDFIARHELPKLLEVARGVTVVWIPVSPSSFDETEISNYQAAFDPKRTLAEMNKAEAERNLVAAAKTIQQAFSADSLSNEINSTASKADSTTHQEASAPPPAHASSTSNLRAVTGFAGVDLSPCYVNRRRIAALIGSDALLRRVPPATDNALAASLSSWAELALFKDAVLSWLRSNQFSVKPIDRLIFEKCATTGQLFFAFRDFFGKGLSNKKAQPELHAAYSFDSKVKLRFLLDRLHVAPGSAAYRLMGHQSALFAFGVIETATSDEVLARPIFIGDLIDRGQGNLPVSPRFWLSRGELSPHNIDNFAKLANEQPAKPGELTILGQFADHTIRQALVEIITGTETVGTAWTPEPPDFIVTPLQVDGHTISAAFLTKPSVDLAPKEQGKLLDRIFSIETIDLIVLQHCGSITAPVRDVLRALAMSHFKLFCAIDGYSTLRLLRAYGKCGL